MSSSMLSCSREKGLSSGNPHQPFPLGRLKDCLLSPCSYAESLLIKTPLHL
ncbi:Hypothetical protein FKW44_024389 [Caligus rogercresseyi]|uniref:Uncharacterized protein n=1 Tax=Caligus rogercresseyi TaxID=217165 RepID=A0A7T8GMQ2_CALRO|nr:Hypothetical protein FKW44_024389 [Caligus rogercresseyi]